MAANPYERFKHLTYADFQRLASDHNLSRHEKVGFPDSYREGKEAAIFGDILNKLPNLSLEQQTVMDVGPGCSGPALMLIELCRQRRHQLVLVDSDEMLAQLPDEPFIRKVPAYYPRECRWLGEEYGGRINVLLTYSVFHYVFDEGNPFDFMDFSLALLADEGEMLIGDIPNVSKRHRFFSSPAGVRFHKQFTGTDDVPAVVFNRLEPGQIDDATITGLILRCRAAGFDTYWLPQAAGLPMANRREDVLVRKP